MPQIGDQNHRLMTFIYSIVKYILLLIVNVLILIGDIVIAVIINTIRFIVTICDKLGKILIFLIKAPFIMLRKIFVWIHRIASRIHPFAHFFLKAKFFTIGIIIASVIFGYYQLNLFISNLPDPGLIGSVNYPVSTEIYDRNGKLLYEVYKDQNRSPILIDKVPTFVTKATIAIEDKDFYKHNGISIYGGIIRALKEIIVDHSLQGGSTITQQLVKTSLLTPERTIERKIKEMILAIWTEQRYSKKQILQMYLNQVPYGGTAYGIQQAARIYFDKDVKDLSLSESAYLAGLPQAPTTYSPYSNPEGAKARRNDVLKKMLEQNYITQRQYADAVQAQLIIVPIQQTLKAPHFVFYVKSLLESYYGVRRVETGGLRVTTSLDLDVQEKAEEILREEIDKVEKLKVSNGAVLVTMPKTGEILAMVGSKDYFESPYGAYNVTTANRQPGSSIKPLMYSLALAKNYTAATMIEDSPIVFTTPGGSSYRPVNYDGAFHGRVSLRMALANSYNVPAVKVLYTLGVSNFIDQAKKLGITTWNHPEQYGLSLTLGGADVKMTDMAVAYGVFANGGDKMPLHPILDIKDYHGRTLEDPVREEKTNVLSSGIAYIISSILSDNDARQSAFGPHSQLEITGKTVAVKTGTTNEKHDNWTIGYTPKVLTEVWVGNNDNSPMDKQLTSGVTGAAPIWNRVMSFVIDRTLHIGLKGETETTISNDFKIPDTITVKACFGGKTEYFLNGTEKNVNCNVYISPTPAYNSTTPTPNP